MIVSFIMCRQEPGISICLQRMLACQSVGKEKKDGRNPVVEEAKD